MLSFVDFEWVGVLLGITKETLLFPWRDIKVVLRNDVRSDVTREYSYQSNVQALTGLLRTENKLIFRAVSQFEGFVTFVF